jgi:hypothetical protein
MPSPYLSKSDFKACFDCRTKLFYRKNRYPTNLDENEYIRMLADGGFMIEVLAKAQFPGGLDLTGERDQAEAARRTREALLADPQAVIYEAAALHGKLLARVDILKREGSTLYLIEVKSISVNSQSAEMLDGRSPFIGKRGEIVSKRKPYLLDVAFQAHVLRLAFPEFHVEPYLCVLDKAHRARACETFDKFRLTRDEADPKARPEVSYEGDLSALAGSKLALCCNVAKETAMLMDDVIARADELAGLLDRSGVAKRIQEPIANLYKECRTCEYRFKSNPPERHGFAECWGSLAEGPHHILDLHNVTRIGTTKFSDPVPVLLANGQASLLDLREDQLGAEGTLQQRRWMQWSCSAGEGREHLPEALRAELRSHQQAPGWPLFFIDFEACTIALPHHPGLHSYEQVAFQWSCHTLDQNGELRHEEWLNTGRDLPNFAFARSLRQALGDHGTIYVWSTYEQTTLARVLRQIDQWRMRDPKEALRLSQLGSIEELEDLAAWIDQLLGPEDEEGKRPDPPRIRDLHALALKHYFHPHMLGRTSIKVVLPAVWQTSEPVRQHPWFADYLRIDERGQPMDPYQTLPALPLGEADEEEAVTEGTGAIRIYQDLIFRKVEDPQFRANREQLLKQYCKLDTLAMVMIWKHWLG